MIRSSMMLTSVVISGLAGCDSAMQLGVPMDQDQGLPVPMDGGTDLIAREDGVAREDGGELATNCAGAAYQNCGGGSAGNVASALYTTVRDSGVLSGDHLGYFGALCFRAP